MIVSVAIFSPLRDFFDYQLHIKPSDSNTLVGCRVVVPFAHSERVGIIVAQKNHSDIAVEKLKAVSQLLDTKPLYSSSIQTLLDWCQSYYQAPKGEVYAQGLPARLRKANGLLAYPPSHIVLTDKGIHLDCKALKRAPRQRSLLRILQSSHGIFSINELKLLHADAMTIVKKLEEKQLVTRITQTKQTSLAQIQAKTRPTLNTEQHQAVEFFSQHNNHYHCILLEGITGSGKTEIYLRMMEQMLSNNKQVLLLVPEIGLTPQLLTRLKMRLAANIGISHSGLSANERQLTWQNCVDGNINVLIGTRSTIFTDLPRLGLIIVDEEHDTSFKQIDSFRYSARDVAVVRAQQTDIPIVLGTATPSLESFANATQGRYHHLKLTHRATGVRPPSIRVVDIRNQSSSTLFSQQLLTEMKATLANNQQIIVFINRRGYSPVLMCYQCGWTAHCHRCDSHMTWHKNHNTLWCHHCNAQAKPPKQCPSCGERDIQPIGQGTQRVEQQLIALFPDHSVARVDRDTVTSNHKFEQLIDDIHQHKHHILVGTQMLAKGHHFSNVTLAALLDIDGGLFSNDFRAPERLAQMMIQVAGRAGRESIPGSVVVQTRHPEHPLLTTLFQRGYSEYATIMLDERKQAQLPPFCFHALLRVKSKKPENNDAFIDMVINTLPENLAEQGISYFGPIAAPKPKKAGMYRAQLLLQSQSRKSLQFTLKHWIEAFRKHKLAKRVRWSIDIDPQDMM